MAKELSPGRRYERVAGEPCPRGTVRERGQQPCRGQLERIESVMSGHVEMECDTCHFKWNEQFTLPLADDQKTGKAPGWFLLPDELVVAVAKANFDRVQALEQADPRIRTKWEVIDQSNYVRVARETLEPVWPTICTWFADFFGVEDPEAKRTLSARRAIEEIAIPTLERYEEKFDTPDKPRAALEATLNAR